MKRDEFLKMLKIKDHCEHIGDAERYIHDYIIPAFNENFVSKEIIKEFKETKKMNDFTRTYSDGLKYCSDIIKGTQK